MTRNERLYCLLTDIDERWIAEAAPRAWHAVQKTNRGRWIRWVSVAACLVLLVGVMLAWDHEHSVTPPIEPDDPHCGEPMVYPSLDEAMSMSPIDELLPRVGYDLFDDVKVYCVPDEIENWNFYCGITMKKGEWYHNPPQGRIEIYRSTEQTAISNSIRYADPERPETYQFTDDMNGSFLENLANTFYAEDLIEKGKALEVIHNRSYPTSYCNGEHRMWRFELYIVCNEYILHYSFLGEFVSEAENIYNIITSSEYFQKLLNDAEGE